MNDKVSILLFREWLIHFWEVKIKITWINQHFKQLNRLAQNFEQGVKKNDQHVYASKFQSDALRKEM